MRYKLLKKITSENGIDIYSPSSVEWHKFNFANGFKKHIVTQDEIYKPYLISYRYYNSVNYDDIILLVNNTDDIFKFEPGIEIKIPYLEDIEKFILENKK